MADKVQQEFLDKEGVTELLKSILANLNEKLDDLIVDEVIDQDAYHVPTSAAVFKAIVAQQKSKYQTVIGDINEKIPLESRSASTIYLQKDNDYDISWTMYIWDPTGGGGSGAWINLGTTYIRMEDYWHKNDLVEMKSTLGLYTLESELSKLNDSAITTEDLKPLTAEEVTEIVEDVAQDVGIVE